MFWYFLKWLQIIIPICRSRELVLNIEPLVFVFETKDNDTFLLYEEGTNNLVSINNDEYKNISHIHDPDIDTGYFSSNGEEYPYTCYIAYNNKTYKIIDLVEPDDIYYFFPYFLDVDKYWSIRELAPTSKQARWWF